MENVLPLTKMECLLNIKDEPEQDYTPCSYSGYGTPMESSLSLPKTNENIFNIKKEEPEQQDSPNTFKSADCELNHVSEHTVRRRFLGQKRLKCLTCKNKFKDCWALYKHRILVHGPIQKPDVHLKATNSTAAVKFQHVNDLLDKYQQKSHNRRETATCAVCESSFKSKAQCFAHQWVHSQKNTFQCVDCDKVFKSKPELKGHQKTHVGVKYFKCEKCGSGFKLHLKFIRHQQTCREASYKCMECKKCFASKTELADHRQVHRGDRPFNCAACGNSFKSKRSLLSHRKVCDQEPPFRCTECNEGFMQVADLGTHMRIHSQESICRYYGVNLPAQPKLKKTNKLKCDECGKGFKLQYLLIRHQLFHLKKKTNICYCGKAFESRLSLTKHQWLHARRQPFKCTVLKSRLLTKKSL